MKESVKQVLSRHRSLAERMAAALAPSFADATSSMYNNITDYVLGPMHGHPYPIASQPRPLPSTTQTPKEGCWTDDSDPSDDDMGMSQSLLVTESSGVADSAVEDPLVFSSTRVNADALSPLALRQHPLALSGQPQQQDQQQDQQKQYQQKQNLAAADPGHTPQVQSQDNQEAISDPGVTPDRPSNQKGGDPFHSDKQPNTYQQAASLLGGSYLSTAQRHANRSLTELKHQFSQDGSARSSFSFTLPFQWIGSKRSRSDDSAHENEGSRSKAHKGQGSTADSPKAQGIMEEPEANRQASYKQHSFLLRFYDDSIERQFYLWQAQQRTKVSRQLCIQSLLQLVALHCLLIWYLTSTWQEKLLESMTHCFEYHSCLQDSWLTCKSAFKPHHRCTAQLMQAFPCNNSINACYSCYFRSPHVLAQPTSIVEVQAC